MRGVTEHGSAAEGMYTVVIAGVTQQNISVADADACQKPVVPK